MKKFIFAAAAMLMVPTAVSAQSTSLCSEIGSLAGSIMEARQNNMSKTQVMSLVERNAVYNLVVSLIDLAYSVPVYPTQEMKFTAIISFENQAEYICYESM